MKLPSIAQAWADYVRTYRRFPLTQICAVIVTIVGIILIENERSSIPSILYNILLSTILAIPLMTALKLAGERESVASGSRRILQAIGVALIVVYAFTIPADLPNAPEFHIFRFFAFAIGCSLLLSFLPFWIRGQINGFWQFNRIIVFRIILAGAFGAVLFAGLGLALAALDNLFGINVPPERYLDLWIMIMGLFVVPFILSGIPDNLRELDEVTDYPRPLKVFGQYVLPPLVMVYFVILYIYIAKIIITWNWPQGWVGRLILGFSATGILAMFVLDPIREKIETHWIKKASRWYYVILLPLIVVLLLALWRRISEYGITEDRYMGVAIGIWLAFIAAYFLLSRTRSIKMIPASLCILTFLISAGPWSMFAVSERSQVQRLKTMLTADSILANGIVQKAPSPLPDDHIMQISSILSYLHGVHGFSKIEPWFAESLRLDSVCNGSWFKSSVYVTEIMGVDFNLYGLSRLNKSLSVSIDPQTGIAISEYEYMVQAKYVSSKVMNFDTAQMPIVTEIATAGDSVVMRFITDSVISDSVVIPLHPLIERIASASDGRNEVEISGENAILEYEAAEFKTMFVILSAFFDREDSTIVPTSYNAIILYSRKGAH